MTVRRDIATRQIGALSAPGAKREKRFIMFLPRVQFLSNPPRSVHAVGMLLGAVVVVYNF